MGIKERRDIEKAEMRRKIMAAAIKIIEGEGYENLSIRKIAAEIEYSPTTIYLYYKDKAGIIADMSDELYRKVMAEVAAVAKENSALSAEKQFHDIMCVFIKGLCGESEMAKAIMYSGQDVIFANESTDGLPANSGIAMMENLIIEGIDRKVFKPNIQNTSWMMISAALGFILSCIANKSYRLDYFDRLVDDFVEILMGGIRL